MKILKKHNYRKGFTVVELMIATVVFSLVLLIAMVALIQIAKLYYKGITNARTQEQSRNIMAEIGQSIQFSRQSIRPPSLTSGPEIAVDASLTTDATNTTGFFCIGPRRYSYVIDRKLSLTPDINPIATERRKESRHVLWVDTPTNGCASNASTIPAVMTEENPCELALNACSDGVELMSENMRLTKITMSPLAFNLWSVSLGIAYGDDDLLAVVDEGGVFRYVCEGSISVTEFCGIAELSTTVKRRL